MNALRFLQRKIIHEYGALLVLLFILTWLVPFPVDIYIYMGVMLWIALKATLVVSNVISLIIIGFILTQHLIRPYELRYLLIALSFITLLQLFINLLIIRQSTTASQLSRTEQALQSEIKLRKIFEESLLKVRLSDIALLDTIPLGILVYSLKGDKRYYHNRAALQLFHAVEDGMPQTIEGLYCFCADHQAEIIQKIYHFNDSKQIFLPPIEHSLCIKDTTIYVKSQIHRITYEDNEALLIMMTDITENKEAETALRESEINHRMIVESSHSAIIVMPYDRSEILYQNPAWNRLLERDNLTIEDITNHILIPNLQEEYMMIMDMFKKTGSAQGETKLRTMTGREISVTFNINSMMYHGKECALLMLHDVTEQRDAEMLKIQLEHERAIRELRDEFVTLMSHEFRTPLAIIQSSVDICLRYSERLTQDQQQYHYRNVLKQVENMVGMVDNILLISSANVDMLEFEPKPYNLGQFIKDLISELTSTNNYPHTIHYVVEGDFHNSYFDSMLIRNIVTPLISNAIRYSDKEAPISVKLTRNNENALIAVTDHGIGIPPDAPNIFEPFIRVTNAPIPNGPGLGLAVVASSAKRHGGNITYMSSPNHTTFTVNIPIMGTNSDNSPSAYNSLYSGD